MKTLFFCFMLMLGLQSMAQSIRYSRIQNRLPDWLWQDGSFDWALDSTDKAAITKKLDELNKIDGKKYPKERWEATKDLSKTISSYFALADIIKDLPAESFHDISLAFKIDPYFDSISRRTIAAAIRIFARTALNKDVINEAFRNSIENCTPFPDKLKDEEEYSTYRFCRSKPRTEASFTEQLKEVLGAANGDPALLLVTAYDGDKWWGYAYLNFYYRPFAQLTRLYPARGYFHVGFNVDSLIAHPDPVFWSSKVAHESYIILDIGILFMSHRRTGIPTINHFVRLLSLLMNKPFLRKRNSYMGQVQADGSSFNIR